MYLRLHTMPELDSEGMRKAYEGINVGDTFEIVDEDEDIVAIMVGDYELAFTKEPDYEGLSYATWFDVVTEN